MLELKQIPAIWEMNGAVFKMSVIFEQKWFFFIVKIIAKREISY